MFRLVAIEVLLFLLPFALYFVVLLLRRRLVAEETEAAVVPVMRLGVVGLVLVSVSLVALALIDRGASEGQYVPDRFENGHLVPGYIK
jgi:hypothetical protein